MPHNDVYTLRHEATVSTAITLLQLKAGANTGFEILSAGITQRGSTASTSESIAIVRKTAAATVTAAVIGTHLFKEDPNAATPDLVLSTTGTGVIGSAEGTDGDINPKEGFNILNGWLHLPVPEERKWVPTGGIIALKFLTAPASQLWQFWIRIREI